MTNEVRERPGQVRSSAAITEFHDGVCQGRPVAGQGAPLSNTHAAAEVDVARMSASIAFRGLFGGQVVRDVPR